MYEPVQTRRYFEQVAQQIEKRILNGELSSGDQLPSERDLAEQFNVSRTVIREAVKALAQKGLVDVRSGKGSFVTNDTSLAVRDSLNLMIKLGGEERTLDLMQVREILEPEIAALAATKISDEEILNLQKCVQVMDETLDPDSWTSADLSFHMGLAKATGNLLIPQIASAIVDLLWEQRLWIGLTKGGPERGQFHHKQILNAVRARDPDRAREAMRDHLLQVREDTETAARSEHTLDSTEVNKIVRKHIRELHEKSRDEIK
jgi:GntR family transcriptional repressor for pyruvate dehydrogenase complex